MLYVRREEFAVHENPESKRMKFQQTFRREEAGRYQVEPIHKAYLGLRVSAYMWALGIYEASSRKEVLTQGDLLCSAEGLVVSC